MARTPTGHGAIYGLLVSVFIAAIVVYGLVAWNETLYMAMSLLTIPFFCTALGTLIEP